MKKTSTFQNGLIWFGAGVSLAEILTGTAFAPLGMAKGFAAILLGHIIGCAMMLLAGLIGGRTGRSAMETVKMSFGQKGGLLFAFLNVLQLVGWTAIMIYDGALAVGGIFAIGRWVWCLVIGALIIVWIAVGVTDLGWINKITMAALFILTLVLCKVIFFSGNAMVGIDGESLTFGAAVELAVAMPLSWLPLISDYTRDAEKPTQATWVLSERPDLVRRGRLAGRDPDRHRLCAAGYGKGLCGHSARSYHRLRHDAAGGSHRRTHGPQRYGDRKNELRPEGRPAVCVPERFAARRLDGHYDL